MYHIYQNVKRTFFRNFQIKLHILISLKLKFYTSETLQKNLLHFLFVDLICNVTLICRISFNL